MSGNGTANGGSAGPWLLGIDTATSRVVVAAARPDGSFLGETSWEAGHRHGEQLLPAIARLTAELGLDRSGIAAIIVGTGPGAFTGLRVGIATAKALAHALVRPIVGVSSGEALIAAAAAPGPSDAPATRASVGPIVLLLPAGPSDRIVVRAGQAPSLLPGGIDPDLADRDVLVAVDLDGRAPVDASARGERARDGLAAAIMQRGVARFAGGDVDDLARLVPDYVTLPRGVTASSGEVAWSRDLR